MIRKLATTAGLVACMTFTLRCRCASTNDVVVQFTQDVDQAKAKWILYSYSSNFKVGNPGTCSLHLKSATGEPIEHGLRRAKNYLLSKDLKPSGSSVSNDGMEATITLSGAPSAAVRETIQKQGSRDLHLSWQCALSAVVRVDAEEEKQVVDQLKEEESVQAVYDAAAPSASSIEGTGDVDGSGTVHVPREGTGPPGSPHAGRVRQARIRSSSLPSSAKITAILEKLYEQKGVRVTLQEEDEEKDFEFYRYDVEHLKGAITSQENYWERLHLRLPIYLAGGNEIRIRVSMGGEYAPGIGNREPSALAYHSLEPTYVPGLHSNIERFIVALSNAIKKE